VYNIFLKVFLFEFYTTKNKIIWIGKFMTEILEHPISSPMTWSGETLIENDGIVSLGDDCIAELNIVAQELQENPLPLAALDPSYFDMPACQALMTHVQVQIDRGIGLSVIDRLPVDQLDEDTAKKLYWLLMSMVGKPVAQKWDGTLIYDVTDTGGIAAAGTGIRSSKTTSGQGFHVDNAFNLRPDFVGLFCLQTAREGGVSGVISFETVYNLLLEERPDVLPRLFEPFYFDRQMEHAPGDEEVTSKPIFESDGETIFCNYSPNVILQGYEMVGGKMDETTRTAMGVLTEICERPGIGKEFIFERGQIQIANNKRIGHRRTAFQDWPERERRRHLVRIWLREDGRSFYHG
jgi:hypothetical protein